MGPKKLQSYLRAGVLAAIVTIGWPSTPAAQEIVGGTQVQFFNYPYFVNIYRAGTIDEPICGGTVVVPGQWVLTAAHCVTFTIADEPDTPPQLRNVWVHWPGTANNVYYVPASVRVHPLWNGDVHRGHDLALIEMPAASAQHLGHAITVGSPWNQFVYAPGVEATMIGTGQTRTQPDDSEAIVLRRVDAPLRSDADMYALFDGRIDFPWNNAQMIGAGSTTEGICFGDSGGPLIVPVGGVPAQIGVASFVNAPAICNASAFAELSGMNLAWVATTAPPVINRWAACFDRYGRVGITHVYYEYQPTRPGNDGGYYGAVECHEASPPPAPTVVRFTGFGSDTKPGAALSKALTSANRQASNAGHSNCDEEDSSVEFDLEVGRYFASVTLACPI